MSTIVVTGAGSGLGKLLVEDLSLCGHNVIGIDREDMDVRKPNVAFFQAFETIDVLINCAGVNKIDWLDDFTEEDWDEVMGVNAKGIFKMTQTLLPWLSDSRGTVLNIVSNASHMPMTCSLAYNASKGAAHIMTLQLARELTKTHGITVFGISPNKLKGTGMSKDIEDQVQITRGWTKEEADEYQRKALLAGEETDPTALSHFICYLLEDKDRHKYLTGCVLPYGA
jgi:NAD(P)-dependent dehydrogenase (short-subunit alcohol dehydrogenase family)